jgi:hypothetical protein
MKVVSMLLTAAHLSRNTSAAPLAALTRRALELAPGAPPQMLATLAHSLVKLAQPSHAALEGGDGRRGGRGGSQALCRGSLRAAAPNHAHAGSAC